MTDEVTPQQVVEQMPGYFVPEKAGSTNATIQFDLSGAHPGKWFITVADGKAESGEGDKPDAKMTMVADSADFVKIFTGQLDGTAAFMQGKLKIKGDMGLAMKMQTMFRRPS